jgi:ADP-heptose:LPS heptosyltransferase
MLDLGPETLRLEFHPTPEEQARVTAWLATHGVRATDPVVGLVPGSGAPVKRWRPEAFARVGDELARRHSARVVITGSAGERPLAQQIAAQMGTQALVAAGETTLGELAALLGRCQVVVGVDSGPMHLAVAQGVPTVHLFGPVDPARFGPWGDPQRHRVVTLEPRLPCMFCNRLDYGPEELPAHPCVRDIPVEAVLTTIEELVSHVQQNQG